MTIAVLGSGVDCCSPSVNLPLYDKIVKQFGAVVSESAFEDIPSKGVFPARNRIIAGLSLAVVVIEEAVKVTNGYDILDTLGIQKTQQINAIPPKGDAVIEESILSILSGGRLTIDELVKQSTYP